MVEQEPSTVTAGIVVIGDEILSGRTKDKNVGFIADYLTSLGIDLKEVRVVADDEGMIVEAVNTLRRRYTYVFTTGGIGPTHDDITADAVAKAFDVSIDVDPRARKILEDHYANSRFELNEARLRMARIPAGADLVDNPVSKAPGFRIGNVHVMAGVPAVMQAMMDAIAPTLEKGREIMTESVPSGLGEGDIAARLGAIQEEFPGVLIGSYPKFDGKRFSADIVLRSRDGALLRDAVAAVETAIARIKEEKSRSRA